MRKQKLSVSHNEGNYSMSQHCQKILRNCSASEINTKDEIPTCFTYFFIIYYLNYKENGYDKYLKETTTPLGCNSTV